MFRNMVTSLFKHQRIRTTDVKAKELRRWADNLITLAKRGDLHARRQALAIVREKEVVHKLFAEAAELYGGRSGGYTRIIKLGRRPGDAAPISLIELVSTSEDKKKKTKKKKKAKGPIDKKITKKKQDTKEKESIEEKKTLEEGIDKIKAGEEKSAEITEDKDETVKDQAKPDDDVELSEPETLSEDADEKNKEDASASAETEDTEKDEVDEKKPSQSAEDTKSDT